MAFRIALSLFALGLFACSTSEPEDDLSTGDENIMIEERGDPPPGFPEPGVERPEMSAEECTDAGGEVVGDIGDGSTHRADYVCASGASPIGMEPVGIEGAVCCPL